MNNLDYKNITLNLIPFLENAGKVSLDIQKVGPEIKIKEDNSPVTNGDIKVNEILTEGIKNAGTGLPIISEETVDLNKKNILKNYWLIDPIDGTKEYIAGKDEFTLNVALIINKKPIIGLVGVPKKNRLFYSYGVKKSFLIEGNNEKKISCNKLTPKNEIVAVSSVHKPSDMILNKLKEFSVTSIKKMASSYKFCVIAAGEYDIYAARERANEWDYAAGHAVAENAGAIITTLDRKKFEYGREDYRNPSLLILRSQNLND